MLKKFYDILGKIFPYFEQKSKEMEKSSSEIVVNGKPYFTDKEKRAHLLKGIKYILIAFFLLFGMTIIVLINYGEIFDVLAIAGILSIMLGIGIGVFGSIL